MQQNEHDFKIEFYKGRSAYTILTRYDFSKEEKKIIYDAILTAKRDHPNMKLIAVADTLLNEVSSTRERVQQSTEEQGNKEFKYAKAKLDYSMRDNLVSPEDKREINMKKALYIYIITLIIAFLAYETFFSHDGWYKEEFSTYSYAEAKEICRLQNSELPSLADLNTLRNYSNYFYQGYLYLTNDNYWVENDSKHLIYNMRTQKTTEVNVANKYEVKCRYDKLKKK